MSDSLQRQASRPGLHPNAPDFVSVVGTSSQQSSFAQQRSFSFQAMPHRSLFPSANIGSISNCVFILKEVELVTSTKLLGLTIANDLTWNNHVTEITKKASKRLFPNSVKESGSSETRSSTVLCIVRTICYGLRITCLFQRSPPVLKERAGAAREKSNVNNNLRKV